MVSFTTTAATVIAFMALVSPSLQAAAVFRGAVAGGRAASAVSSATSNNDNNNHRRFAREVAASGVPEDLFHDCLNTVKTQPPRLFVNQKDHTAQLTEVNDVCIQAANRFNQLPNLADIEKKEGKISVSGKDTILLSGVEGQVSQLLQKGSKQQTGAAPAKGASAAPAKPAAQ